MGESATQTDLKPDNENQAGVDESAVTPQSTDQVTSDSSNPNAKWYVVHTYSGHENKVSQALKQRIESEHLEHKIIDVLVPTQDKIEIKAGKKEQVKEKIFPGYILVKMVLDDASWLAVRTTQGVTSFVGIGNKPTPIPDHEVKTIVKFMSQGATSTFKDVYAINDTIKIIDGPFSEFIGKVDTVDKEKGKVRVLVSIFGRETPVELDFLQVQKL
ncbi:transcription termination/antitermination factor NusG [Candidatus Daviesbacteria bacterium]|nr:transcription termination/antitermination factor NusG [Candidatus Daviesbacteria bacterium]